MVHLVTGAASLVGAKLCARLVAAGRRVVGVDDYTSGSFSHVAPLVKAGAMTWLEQDVADLRIAEPVEAVYHLALPSSRRTCDADPMRTTVTCASGTARMLALAEAHEARIVLVTSDERWGPGLRTAEALASEAVRTRRADVRHVRVASAFDPGMVPERDVLVSRLVLDALAGTPFGEEGDDDPLRVCWADDAALTIERTMRHDLRIPPVLAPAWEVTPRALAGLVATIAGAPVPAPETMQAPGGIVSSRGARSRPLQGRTPTLPETLPASLLLGLEASVSLEAALLAMLEGFTARITGVTRSARRRASTRLRAS